MQEATDTELLRQYAEQDSEAAFAALVTRHVNLVYSAALRKTGNAGAAEEVTQAVFIVLARKAHGLGRGTVISGWLYQAARLTAANFLRREIRRVRREQEVCMQSFPNETEAWPQIVPLLDDAMGRLNARERDAVVLRFFEGKSYQEIGTTFGGSENAAKKRVAHALEKLRIFFHKRGVDSTAATIAETISTHSIQAAPLALAKSATALALAKGATASTSTLTLIKGALKIMAWTKAKTAIVAAAVVLLAAGITTATVKQISARHDADSWRSQPNFDSRVLDRATPQLKILPAKFTRGGGYGWTENNHVIKMMGLCQPVKNIVTGVYEFDPLCTIFKTDLPGGRYDYIASLPSGNQTALEAEIKKQFGLVAHTEMIETNVLFLEVETADAPGLARSTQQNEYERSGNGMLRGDGLPVSSLCGLLEEAFGKVVIDKTGLKDRYKIDLEWNSPDDLKLKLGDQLGLELVPTNMPIQMLVVEKAK
ncbi:MAG: sigma-70 family RNA polymerase sigma factor [Limisphaerales bacterium]